MPRHCSDLSLSEEPPKKKQCYLSSYNIKSGEYMHDIQGKKWKLGKAVGVGGFGQIYLASDTKEVETDCPYVAKIERHKHGPLFVEINCYLRIAKEDLIETWKREKKLTSIGMPYYVASGSHIYNDERYRFLILPKYDVDLEKILQEKMKFNLKTVLTIACQIMDVLEYIHSKGYIHSDIKASNLLLNYQKKKIQTSHTIKTTTTITTNNIITNQDNTNIRVRKRNVMPVRSCRIKTKQNKNRRNLRPIRQCINYADDSDREDDDFDKIVDDGYNSGENISSDSDMEIKSYSNKNNNIINNNNNDDSLNSQNDSDQIYLLDYGLACKYLLSNGEHKPCSVDERKAHAGTISFCSRDAHKGLPSRRSDLESLGYNIIYWLTGNLPWIKDADNPEIVAKLKYKAFTNLDYFLHSCFKFQYPKFLLEYFNYLQNLQFQEKPKYDYLKTLFKNALRQYGYKDDQRFDFDNLEGWGQKQKKVLKKGRENEKVKRSLFNISRPPLLSNNIPIKPLLRKKIKNKVKKKDVHWSQILIDPEEILKQARKNLEVEPNVGYAAPTITELELRRMNPTPAMLDIFHRIKERGDSSPTYRGDSALGCNIEGYTPAMLAVVQRKQERLQMEEEKLPEPIIMPERRRRGRPQKKRNSGPKYSPPKTRSTKSVPKLELENLRKEKGTAIKRCYSLRG